MSRIDEKILRVNVNFDITEADKTRRAIYTRLRQEESKSIRDDVKIRELEDQARKIQAKIDEWFKDSQKLDRVQKQYRDAPINSKERKSCSLTFARLIDDFERKWGQGDVRNLKSFAWASMIDRNRVVFYNLRSQHDIDMHKQKTFKKLYGVKDVRRDYHGKGQATGYMVMREFQKRSPPMKQRNHKEPRRYVGEHKPVYTLDEIRHLF